MKRKLQFLKEHWYGALVCSAVVFLVFVSDHSMYQIWRLWSEQSDVKNRIEEYKEKTTQYRLRLGEVNVDDATKLEEYARLKLGMKKANEDVFVFDD